MSVGMGCFPLDIFAVKQYGIARWQREFFWPVSDLEFRRMCDEVESLLTRHINEDPAELSDVLLIKWQLLSEYAHFLHAVWVLTRIEAQGFMPLYTGNTLWYGDLAKNLLNGKKESLSKKRNTTLPEISNQRTIKGVIAMAGRTLRLNVTPRKFFDYVRSGESGKVYGTPDHLVTSYLRRKHGWYFITSARQWIPPLRDLPATFTDRLREYAVKIVEELSTVVRTHAIALNATHLGYLRRFTEDQLFDGARALLSLREYLKAHPFKQVIVPILGAPFQRAIALTVRALGGRVTSFAHGGSIGLFDVPTLSLSEFALADEFVTYTKGSAELFERIQKNHPPLRGNRVRIVAAETPYYFDLWKRWKGLALPSTIKKVMVIGIPHAPWRKSHGTAMLSLMHLDFELRLIKVLKDAGYKVIYKAHPDRLSEISGIFDDIATVVTKDFKYTAPQADAYIFGALRTTAFPIALTTNKPIILLQMKDEYPRPFDDAMALLKKRCAVVSGWFDERNRIMFDPQEFLTVLSRSPIPPDTKFVQKYLFP